MSLTAAAKSLDTISPSLRATFTSVSPTLSILTTFRKILYQILENVVVECFVGAEFARVNVAQKVRRKNKPRSAFRVRFVFRIVEAAYIMPPMSGAPPWPPQPQDSFFSGRSVTMQSWVG